MTKVMTIFRVILFFSLIIIISSCKEDSPESPEQIIEIALDAFVSDLISNPPDSVGLSNRIKDYLLSNSISFFGATVTLLDSNNKATYSPFWYRLNDSLAFKNLADTAYHINDQFWLRQVVDGGIAIWTDDYFDAGGGEIWMKTRSVPVYINGKIVAVATTDLPLK